MKKQIKVLRISFLLIVIIFSGRVCLPLHAAPTNCGTDFDCFIQFAGSCQSAQMDLNEPIEMMGVISRSHMIYEIRKDTSGDCILYNKVVSMDIDYSEKMRQRLIAQEMMTKTQIDEKIIEINTLYNNYEGTEGECRGSIIEIVNILKKWQKKSFSTNDLDALSCSGTYFDQMNTTWMKGEDGGWKKDQSNDNSFDFSLSMNVDDTDKDDDSCRNKADCPKEYYCLNHQCVQIKEMSDCDVYDRFDKGYCIKIVAVHQVNPNLCQEISPSPTSYDGVQVDCFVEIALSKDDPGVCKKLVDIKSPHPSRFDCYLHYAISKKDKSYCNYIADPLALNACHARASIAKQYPELTVDELRNSTFEWIARKVNDKGICQYETLWFEKKKCLKSFER